MAQSISFHLAYGGLVKIRCRCDVSLPMKKPRVSELVDQDSLHFPFQGFPCFSTLLLSVVRSQYSPADRAISRRSRRPAAAA